MTQLNTRTIRVHNMRLAFPHLWEKTQVNGEGEFKFRATLIMEPDHLDRKSIRSAVIDAAKTQWKDKARDVIAVLDKKGLSFIQDGDLKANLAGYAGNFYVNLSADKQPTILDMDKTQLTERSGKPYGGCYVNAIIEIWAQDNKYGKRINGTLLGIQFAGDGEPFGAGQAPADVDAFDDISDIGENDDGIDYAAGADEFA